MLACVFMSLPRPARCPARDQCGTNLTGTARSPPTNKQGARCSQPSGSFRLPFGLGNQVSELLPVVFQGLFGREQLPDVFLSFHAAVRPGTSVLKLHDVLRSDTDITMPREQLVRPRHLHLLELFLLVTEL
jgi:hypothetical protein